MPKQWTPSVRDAPATRRAGSRRAARSTAYSRVYLVMTMVLMAVAGLLVGRYFAAPTSPAVASGLGSIPAATAGAVPGQASPGAPAAPDPPLTALLGDAPAPFTMKAAAPVSIRARAVDITSSLGRVALNPDGTIEVPTDAGQAAWYRLGPTPGELGPAVIVGHLDSREGPAVFYRLSSLRPGQMIEVTRIDRSVAHFRIDAINTYRRDHFPTETVYGPIDYAGLRLITCGGAYNRNTKAYESNVVVFASLVHA